jgi:hypothetical protein
MALTPVVDVINVFICPVHVWGYEQWRGAVWKRPSQGIDRIAHRIRAV